jgi:acyl carrier protein
MDTSVNAFDELCEWLRVKVKWPEKIPIELNLIEHKVVNSLIFVEFLLMLEEAIGQEIEVDESLQLKVSSLRAVKDNFFS